MEVLGSPFISRAPMGGAMLSEYRKLVYADNRYNDNTLWKAEKQKKKKKKKKKNT